MKVGDLITPQGDNIFVVFQKKWIMSRHRYASRGAPPSADFYPQSTTDHRVAEVAEDNQILFQGLTLDVWPSEEFKVAIFNEEKYRVYLNENYIKCFYCSFVFSINQFDDDYAICGKCRDEENEE